MSDGPPAERLNKSQTEMTELLMPDGANNLGRALGAVVLHWMDVCGAIAAMRFASRNCVTAAIDHVDFHAPIQLGEVADVHAYVFETGATSLDVKVRVLAENPRTGESRCASDAFFTFVAIDDEGRPTQVPDVVCETDVERQHRQDAVEGRREQLEALRERLEE